jgi:hypothetical protein
MPTFTRNRHAKSCGPAEPVFKDKPIESAKFPRLLDAQPLFSRL